MSLLHPDPETGRWFANEIVPHERVLRGYLRGYAREVEIDDVLQETYIKVCRTHAREKVRCGRGLLFTTARNVMCDFIRRRAAAKTTNLDVIEWNGVPDESANVAESVSRRQEFELLEIAIASLPERCRAILQLRRQERLSHKEIAVRLGISEHTVGVQLTRALRRCEEFFAGKNALP